MIALRPTVRASFLLTAAAIFLGGCGGSGSGDAPALAGDPAPVAREEVDDPAPVAQGEVRMMWDVWFDTKAGRGTQVTPLVLDLNGDGRAGITGRNILGDGRIDGPTVLFDMVPDEVSFEFASDYDRPGAGLPEAPGGHWVDAQGNTAAAPPPGRQTGHAGWKYLDADGNLVGLIQQDGRYHYGAQERREVTEWLVAGGGDGFLAVDVDGDGQISDITELFGTDGPDGARYANGFEKLAALHDTDGDGRIAGAELDGLLVWKDDNADGVVQPGELLSLASLGIVAIDVAGYDEDTMTGSWVMGVPDDR